METQRIKLVVLAAGFATRLYPLTRDRAKPLLPVAGKPMIEHVLDNLAGIAGLGQVTVVANGRFAQQFEDWCHGYRTKLPQVEFSLVNDGVVDETKRLGAIGDLDLVLQREGMQDDVIVVAGDNLFSERLDAFGAFCREKNAPVLGVYDVKDLQEVRKYNALKLDAEGRLEFFEEKPKEPTSTITGIALYYYPRRILPLIRNYVAAGHNADQPGRLVQWLYPQMPFYTWKVPGIWFDIGSHETLAEANRIFGELRRPA